MSNGGVIGPRTKIPITVANYRGVRYIRVYGAGSNANSSTHFVEVQANTAVNGGTNRALNIGSSGGISQYTGGTPEFTVNNTNWQILTNGNTSSSDYIGFGSSNAGIQLDLGAIYYDIAEIRIWNYYADSRIYNNVTVFISTDNSNWITLYGPTNTATTASGVSAPVTTVNSTSYGGMWKLEDVVDGVKEGTWPSMYETLTYTITSSGGGVSISGNGTTSFNVFKTSGTLAWNLQAYCATPFVAPCTIEFNKNASSTDDGNSYAMISWNSDPTTNDSYTSLDHAAYPYMQSAYSVYHNSNQVLSSGTWSSSNKFYLVYDTDGYIRHYNGSTLLYSANYGTGNTVYVDSSYYSNSATNAGFSNVRVRKQSWNGTAYV